MATLLDVINVLEEMFVVTEALDFDKFWALGREVGRLNAERNPVWTWKRYPVQALIDDAVVGCYGHFNYDHDSWSFSSCEGSLVKAREAISNLYLCLE
tara:strand:+ start:1415 stop:1708 length:294 start_codon:yes stop_codon:yes gene_type:complete